MLHNCDKGSQEDKARQEVTGRRARTSLEKWSASWSANVVTNAEGLGAGEDKGGLVWCWVWVFGFCLLWRGLAFTESEMWFGKVKESIAFASALASLFLFCRTSRAGFVVYRGSWFVSVGSYVLRFSCAK